MTTLSAFLNNSYQGAQGITGALKQWAVKTANYTAVDGDRFIAKTTAGSFTVTLPASPTTGNYIQITDGGDWSVNNLLINMNGSTVEGVSDTLAINIPNVTVEFIYDGTTWQFVASTGPAGVVSADTAIIYAIGLGF